MPLKKAVVQIFSLRLAAGSAANAFALPDQKWVDLAMSLSNIDTSAAT